MATFRNISDINMNDLYGLQRQMIHIHFVELGHLCDSENKREAMKKTMPRVPSVRVFYYDPILSSTIRTIHLKLKEDISYPSSRICPACGQLPPDADIGDEASGSESD